MHTRPQPADFMKPMTLKHQLVQVVKIYSLLQACHLRHDTCMSESNVPPLKLSQVLNRKSTHQHITAAGSSLLSSEKVHAKLTC